MRLSAGTINYLMTLFEAQGPLDTSVEPDEVVRLFQDGLAPFDHVLRRYFRLLIQKSEVWVPGYTCDEVFQELAIKTFWAAQRWDRDRGVKFITYLSRCLAQHLDKLIREANFDKRKINQETTESYEALNSESLSGEVGQSYGDLGQIHTPDDDFAKVEIMEGVSLTSQERICVELIFEGCKNVDIAKRLGLTKGRITTIFKGLGPRFEFLLEAQG